MVSIILMGCASGTTIYWPVCTMFHQAEKKRIKDEEKERKRLEKERKQKEKEDRAKKKGMKNFSVKKAEKSSLSQVKF